MHGCYRALIFLALLPGPLTGQSLEQRIRSLEDGTVRLSFAARPGVCGDGVDGVTLRRSSDEWENECEPRLVRVALRVAGHQVHSIRTYAGGRWLSDTTALDLGTVSAREAAPYFISLAQRTGDQSVAGDPLLPPVLADSVTIWPALLGVARNIRLPRKTRARAVFWLSQAAGSAVAGTLDSIASDASGDREVRKQAVFALSQRSGNEGVPALIRVARTSPDPELRKKALFWLGQSEDPRALDLFEEILR